MTSLMAAFILGLLSTLHCIGMCGPIALALPLNRTSKLSIAAGTSVYSVGRSAGYSLMGVLVGLIGMSAALFGVLQVLSVISGALIVIFAWTGYTTKNGSSKINQFVMQRMSRFLQSKPGGHKKLFFIGFINAFLPCGMVYVALLSALNTGGIVPALLYMFVFGLGTLPGFISIGVLRDYFLKLRFFNKKIIIASFLTVVGGLLILRGLNLGIPYISPKTEKVINLEAEKASSHSCDEIKMECCSSTNQ